MVWEKGEEVRGGKMQRGSHGSSIQSDQIKELATLLLAAFEIKLETEIDLRIIKSSLEDFGERIEGLEEIFRNNREVLNGRLQRLEELKSQEEKDRDRRNDRVVAWIGILPWICGFIGGLVANLLGGVAFNFWNK